MKKNMMILLAAVIGVSLSFTDGKALEKDTILIEDKELNNKETPYFNNEKKETIVELKKEKKEEENVFKLNFDANNDGGINLTSITDQTGKEPQTLIVNENKKVTPIIIKQEYLFPGSKGIYTLEEYCQENGKMKWYNALMGNNTNSSCFTPKKILIATLALGIAALITTGIAAGSTYLELGKKINTWLLSKINIENPNMAAKMLAKLTGIWASAEQWLRNIKGRTWIIAVALIIAANVVMIGGMVGFKWCKNKKDPMLENLSDEEQSDDEEEEKNDEIIPMTQDNLTNLNNNNTLKIKFEEIK